MENHKIIYLSTDDFKDEEKAYHLFKDLKAKCEFYDDDLQFDDLESILYYTYEKPCKGIRGEYGQPLEPDFDGGYTDLYVFIKVDDKEIDITDMLSLNENDLVDLIVDDFYSI